MNEKFNTCLYIVHVYMYINNDRNLDKAHSKYCNMQRACIAKSYPNFWNSSRNLHVVENKALKKLINQQIYCTKQIGVYKILKLSSIYHRLIRETSTESM